MELSRWAKEHFMETASLCDVNIYDNYSGRGMFGESCLGVSGHEDDLDSFVIDLVAEAPKSVKSELRKLAKSVRKDQLGKGMIYYFPNYQF